MLLFLIYRHQQLLHSIIVIIHILFGWLLKLSTLVYKSERLLVWLTPIFINIKIMSWRGLWIQMIWRLDQWIIILFCCWDTITLGLFLRFLFFEWQIFNIFHCEGHDIKCDLHLLLLLWICLLVRIIIIFTLLFHDPLFQIVSLFGILYHKH